MDTQIIISREDNTDFLSLGFIQTDTSLVSALGGALASFAEEIGLSGNDVESAKTKDQVINFSRFQNGVLASKMVQVEDQNPIILLAIKGYDGQDKELNFLVDYAENLAKEIVLKFMDDYQSIGLIPKIDDAYEIIVKTANQMYRKSSDKVRYFTKNFKAKIASKLDLIWKEQIKFEKWTNSNSKVKISAMTQSEFQLLLAKYFYIIGIKDDAIFPLVFASNTNPLNEISKVISSYLNKKSSIARKEITNEVNKIIQQLCTASKALSTRGGSLEIEDVELINEGFIFEKIHVAKTDKLKSTVQELKKSVNKDLYKKLFKKYPLHFASMSKDATFDKDELENVVNKALKSQLKKELSDKQWILEKILDIIRQVITKYSPGEITKKQDELLEKVYLEFINSLKKEHPFIIFSDPILSGIEKHVRKVSKDALEKFRTSLDEAVILYNVIGQTYSALSNESSHSTQDLMILYFLQSVIEPYQLREVPDMVYTLITECLSNTAYGKKQKPSEIVSDSIKQFEDKIQFKILAETKKLVLQRISKAKPTLQRFENFENVFFFFQSFRTALETTLTKILQTIFGPEKLPKPPNELIRLLNKLTFEIQSSFIIIEFIRKTTKRPGGRELFSKDAISFLIKNSKFKSILPTPLELARTACDKGWFKSVDGKKKSKITDTQLKSLKVKISALKMEGKIDNLLKDPFVFEKLWIKFAPIIIDKRQNQMKKLMTDLEKQAKTSAGNTSGKKKYGTILRKLKSLNRSLTNLVAGGGIMRKLFVGSKELSSLALETTTQLLPSFNYLPQSFQNEFDKRLHSKLSNLTSLIPDFQDLLPIYASLWIANSKFIDNLENELFWEGLLKNNNGRTNLEKKITQNLRMSYKKGSKAQKETIRRTLVEEILPEFNNLIRATLAMPFEMFRNDKVIKYDQKEKEWYLSLGNLTLPKKYLKIILGKLENLYFVKESDDGIDIRYSLKDFPSQKRSKDDQSIEIFLRRAIYILLSKNELKAIEFFSELNEDYIGKDAANTFYSYFRSLAQMIISPVE